MINQAFQDAKVTGRLEIKQLFRWISQIRV